MKKYQATPTGSVIELTTGQVIMTVTKPTKAKELVKSLNSGGGFKGQTPEFFTQNLT